MVNVINPITRQMIPEDQVAELIHAVAQDMMERRAHLLQNAINVPRAESRVYRKQSRLLEEYAATLDAIYYQLEPTKWDPETSGDILRYAQTHHIPLPDWMSADRMKPGKTENDERIKETTGEALDRFENEGGRVWGTQ